MPDGLVFMIKYMNNNEKGNGDSKQPCRTPDFDSKHLDN